MSKKIRVGFVGAGGIAGTHIRWLKPVEDVEVIALSDPRDGACEQLVKSQDLGDAKAFKDYKQMLKMKDIDAVSVCTPNWLHKEPTIAALKAGKHVMVEKPMAMKASEAKAMCDTAKAAKKVLTIGFQHRFSPTAQFARKAVDDGLLGDVLYCRAHALRRRGIPSWGVFGQKDLQGGGPLIDIGVHIIEMSLYVMGMPNPIAASASCHTYMGNKKPEATAPWGDWDYQTYTVEDLATGYVRFDNGATLSIEASFAAHLEDNAFNSVFMGTKAGAIVDGGSARLFTDMAGKMVNIAPTVFEKDEAFGKKMRYWIEAIRGGKNQAPGEDGLAVQKILDALYLSSEKGKEVAIK